MDIKDKIELCKGYRAIKLMANVDGNNDLMNLLNEMEFEKLLRMETKYHFFNKLHKQTKLDNVISMMKIFESLELELPNIRIDISNIDKTCDELWDSINEQIPISDNDYDTLIRLMGSIVEDDEINHPNTKRKLNNVLENLRLNHNVYDYGGEWVEFRIIEDDDGNMIIY